MELTPELLLEAKFGPSRRGYDMEEVDDFLERVAQALDVLLGRLTEEFTRAEGAEAEIARLRRELEAATAAADGAAPPAAQEPAPESAPAEPRTESSAEEAMRLLVHAERTAESVMAEARTEAEKLRNEAETSATAMRAESEALLQRARNDAESEARKAGEATRRAVQDEVNALRSERDQLAAEARTAKRWIDENRARVRTAVRDLQRIIDDPNALREIDLPSVPADTAMSAPASTSAPSAPDTAADEPVVTDLDDTGEPTVSMPAIEADADLVDVTAAPQPVAAERAD